MRMPINRIVNIIIVTIIANIISIIDIASAVAVVERQLASWVAVSVAGH